MISNDIVTTISIANTKPSYFSSDFSDFSSFFIREGIPSIVNMFKKLINYKTLLRYIQKQKNTLRIDSKIIKMHSFHRVSH